MNYIEQDSRALSISPKGDSHNLIGLFYAQSASSTKTNMATANQLSAPRADGDQLQLSERAAVAPTHDVDYGNLFYKRHKAVATFATTATPPPNSSLGNSCNSFLSSETTRLLNADGSPTTIPAGTAKILRSFTLLQGDDSRDDSSVLDTQYIEHSNAMDTASYPWLIANPSGCSNPILTALPLMSSTSSRTSATTHETPFPLPLQELPWFPNNILHVDEDAAPASRGFMRPGPSQTTYLPAGDCKGSTSTSVLRHARSESNYNNNSGNSNLIYLLGSSYEVPQNIGEQELGVSDFQAHVMAHPLFQHLLNAHLACVRMGCPPDRLRPEGQPVAEQFTLVEQDLQAKYTLLARKATAPPDKDHLDYFMMSFILLLQTFREQLREHLQLHWAEAVSGCQELKEAFLRLTGDTRALEDMACSTSTMSDDDDSLMEDDDNYEEAAVAHDGYSAEPANMYHDDDMSPIVGTSLSDIDRPLMERLQKVLKSELKQNYRKRLWEVREEIMRKRRAGKLPGSTISLLRHWWDDHSKWPYPTEEEKQRLVQESGLELKQINNWFINQRKRNWTTNPALEGADQMDFGHQSFSFH